MTGEEVESMDLQLMVKKQAYIIEDLANLCHELINELLRYRNMGQVSDDLDQILEEKWR